MDFNANIDRIANVVLVLGFLPAAWFTVDYVIVRPLRHYTPWWESGIGWMFAMLGIAITAIGGFVVSSLVLGPDYPGRHLFRLLGFSAFAIATTMLLVVYLIERGSPEPVLFRKKESTHERR